MTQLIPAISLWVVIFLYSKRILLLTGMLLQVMWRKDVLLHKTYLYFQLDLLHSVSYLFFHYQSPFLFLCTVFDVFSSNIDEVLSINPSVSVFLFGDFSIHHKDGWLAYSGRTDRLCELCYKFAISSDFTQMVHFLF